MYFTSAVEMCGDVGAVVQPILPLYVGPLAAGFGKRSGVQIPTRLVYTVILHGRVQGLAKGEAASEDAPKKEAPKFNAAPPPLTSYTADVALAMASATMAGRQGAPVAPAVVQAVRHALHCPRAMSTEFPGELETQTLLCRSMSCLMPNKQQWHGQKLASSSLQRV